MQDQYLLNSAFALSHQHSSKDKSYLRHGYLGGIAGLFMDSLLHPMDTVRTRVKTNAYETVKLLSQFKTMARHEGLLSYFKGFSCTLAGSFIANGSFFFIYEKLKHNLKHFKALPQDAIPFLAAFTGGLLSNTIYMPFIAIRTRMQLNSPHYDYKNVLDGITKVLQHEGFRKLYLGGPAFFVQIALDTSLTFGFYEFLHKALKSWVSDSSLLLTMISSVGAASMAAVAVNPLDVLVARMQTMNANMLEPCSIPGMIKRIYTHEGLGGFMKGVTGTMSQYSMAALILFPTYEALKKAYGLELKNN